MVDAKLLAKPAEVAVGSALEIERELEPEQSAILPLGGLVAGEAGAVRRAAAASDPLGGAPVPADVSGVLARRQGQGAPLPVETTAAMGDALGHDFAGVRVHHDAQANDIARSVQAEAFTHGSDLYFAKGAYDPGSASGTHLLAHELAHVAQQREGRHQATAGGLTVGRADDPAETEAEATAAQVVSSLRRRAARPSKQHLDEGTQPGGGLASLRRHASAVAAGGVVIRRDLQKDWAKGSKRIGSRSKLLKGVDKAVSSYAKHVADGAVAATLRADLTAILTAMELWGKTETSKRSDAATALRNTVQSELAKLQPKRSRKTPKRKARSVADAPVQDEPSTDTVEPPPTPNATEILAQAKAVVAEDTSTQVVPTDAPGHGDGTPPPQSDVVAVSTPEPVVSTPDPLVSVPVSPATQLAAVGPVTDKTPLTTTALDKATSRVVEPVVVPKTGKQLFEEAIAAGAPDDAAMGVERMDALRAMLLGMQRSDKDLIASDDALMAKARIYIGPKEYISLLAAVGMYRKKTKGGVSESMHMTGAEADTFIQTNIKDFSHLAPYIEAAANAGKKGEGFVATLGDEDWNKVYELEFPTEAIGSDDEKYTNAFASTKHRDEPAILHHDRGTRSTAIHESMHRYATDDVNMTWGFSFNEGVTEYFTRLLTNADGKPAKEGGTPRKNYQANWQFLTDMLWILGGDDTARQTQLAEINFSGKTDLLKKQFVKACKAKSVPDDDIEDQWTDFDAAIRSGDWAVARAKLPAP
jgi:Domain of unknown function (DUF4157)